MKKAILNKCILISIFCCFSSVISAQDKVVLRSGDTISVKITKDGSEFIEFTYPNETLINQKNKKEINCIIFSSGRTEICNQKLQLPTIKSKDDWEKVIITYLPSDVDGLIRVDEVKATSGWGGAMGSSIGYKGALKKLKKQAAKMGACIILITDRPNSTAAALGGGVQVVGVAYK
jgi:hypothetical protein